MTSKKLLQQTFGLTLVVLLLVGCGGAQTKPAATPVPPTDTPMLPTATPTATPVPPTATPTLVPPTPTPACALECTGGGTLGANGLPQPTVNIRITCESGQYTQSMRSWRVLVEGKGIVTRFEGTRTYDATGNEYTIVADAWLDFGDNHSVTTLYHAKVTGGVFGDTPQACESD